MTTLRIVFWLAFIFLMTACASSKKRSGAATEKKAQASTELYNAITQMDSLLFDAFNKRNLEIQKDIFATDLEFYHDKGGLTNYSQTIESTRRLFSQDNGLRRTLIPGSLQVYPVKDYGAIQLGRHRFCHQEGGKEDCGTFAFVHIWRKTAGGWKLARVVSYDH